MVIVWLAWLIAPLWSMAPTFAVYVPAAEYTCVVSGVFVVGACEPSPKSH